MGAEIDYTPCTRKRPSNDGYLTQKGKGNFLAAIGSNEHMTEALAAVSVDRSDDFTAEIIRIARLCNKDVGPSPPQAKAILLMVDNGVTEDWGYPVLLPDVRDKLTDFTIIDPPGRLSGIGNIAEAHPKRKIRRVGYSPRESSREASKYFEYRGRRTGRLLRCSFCALGKSK